MCAEPGVARDGRLQREQPLNRVLDAEEVVVHLVVEGDHLRGELPISLLERTHRTVDGAHDALAHLLELGLDRFQCGVD